MNRPSDLALIDILDTCMNTKERDVRTLCAVTLMAVEYLRVNGLLLGDEWTEAVMDAASLLEQKEYS